MPTKRECVPSSVLSDKYYSLVTRKPQSLIRSVVFYLYVLQKKKQKSHKYRTTHLSLQEINWYTFVQFESTASFIFLNKGLLAKNPHIQINPWFNVHYCPLQKYTSFVLWVPIHTFSYSFTHITDKMTIDFPQSKALKYHYIFLSTFKLSYFEFVNSAN